MQKYDDLWQDINMLLSQVRKCQTLVDDYYKQFGNDAPGILLTKQINKLKRRIDEAHNMTR